MIQHTYIHTKGEHPNFSFSLQQRRFYSATAQTFFGVACTPFHHSRTRNTTLPPHDCVPYPPAAAAPLSSMSDPKPRNYGEVATTVENRSSAKDALQKSCYFKIDFGINEEATVYEAVQRFAAYNIGALAVTDDDKKVIGIVSERDYVSKVNYVHSREKMVGKGISMYPRNDLSYLICSEHVMLQL